MKLPAFFPNNLSLDLPRTGLGIYTLFQVFTEEFLFEPRLEEGISPAILTELEALDIKALNWNP